MLPRLTRVLTLATVVSAHAVTAAAPNPPIQRVEARGSADGGRAYPIGHGDVLDVTVFEVEELSQSVVVGPSGMISLPLVGEVAVGALTTAQVETTLKRLYGRGLLRDPQISVRVVEFHSRPVSVLGAVREPGVYQLQGRRRLVEVLAMAGGLSDEAGETVTISRRVMSSAPAMAADTAAVNDAAHDEVMERSEFRIPLREVLRLREEDRSNPFIEPYDTVQVEKAGLIYVLGAVKQPGGFPVRQQEDMTVLRAVSLAGGLARHSAPQKSRVIRPTDSGKQEIPIRIREILSGRRADSPLRVNDVLFVPDSRAKGALSRSSEAVLQMLTGIVIWRR